MPALNDTTHTPRSQAGLSLQRHRDRVQLAIEHGVFGVLPVIVTIFVRAVIWMHGWHGQDFSLQYWVAGSRVLHGLSPYPGVHAPVLGLSFPYPAFTALCFVPFALIPRGVSADLFTAVCIASPLLSLRILNVRDWRLYGLVLLLAPVLAGWQAGNLSLPLVLGVAALWRFRDRPIVAGALVVVLISLKPFLWPLALWLLISRRWRATAYGAVIGVVLTLASWTVIGGVAQVHRFLHVTSSITHAARDWGYSVGATLMHFGLTQSVATTVAVIASLALVAACISAGRRRDERAQLVLIVALILCASPVTWLHYFALLIVPLAVIRPRLGPIWLMLFALWACPFTRPAPWQSIVAVVTVCGVLAGLLAITARRGEQPVMSASSPAPPVPGPSLVPMPEPLRADLA